MSNRRDKITTVNTFESWLEGMKNQIEMWRDNDVETYFLVGEWHDEKFPKYSLKTPKEAAGSICKVAYAPDVFQDDKTMEAFKNSDKEFSGLLNIKSTTVANPDHEQVYTPEELYEKAEKVFDKYREKEDNYVVVGGVLYNGISVTSADNKPYKRLNKQKYDWKIFESSRDSVGQLGRKSRVDWYGSIIVKEKHLTDKWREKCQEDRSDYE